MRNYIMAMLLVFLSYSPAIGGIRSWSGEDPLFWRTHAIVVAEAHQTQVRGRNGQMQLKVLAVVATEHIIRTTPNVAYEASGSGNTAYGGHLPRQNKIYVFCLDRDDKDWVLEPGVISFFDSRCAVEQIESLDDPKLARLTEKIAKLQKAARQKPPAEQEE